MTNHLMSQADRDSLVDVGLIVDLDDRAGTGKQAHRDDESVAS